MGNCGQSMVADESAHRNTVTTQAVGSFDLCLPTKQTTRHSQRAHPEANYQTHPEALEGRASDSNAHTRPTASYPSHLMHTGLSRGGGREQSCDITARSYHRHPERSRGTCTNRPSSEPCRFEAGPLSSLTLDASCTFSQREKVQDEGEVLNSHDTPSPTKAPNSRRARFGCLHPHASSSRAGS